MAPRDGEPDEVNEANGISYPSPGAETMDAGPFYHTAPRDGAPDHHEHHEHPDQHLTDQSVPGHEHTELPPQDAEASHQHATRPPNLEELQLAAQLGEGLAGTPLMPATDPNMNVEDPSLRSIMPHPDPEQQQTTAYVHDTPASDPMVQHGLPVSVAPAIPHQYSMDSGIPPRKRSKVSRACDECRRKKIKCDAPSDTGETPCSSCSRSSIRCLFSRVPQKRGPSKGYIKELADRIHSIENKLESEGALSHDDLDRLFAPERPRAQNSSLPADDSSRKRPYSSISSGDFGTPIPARQTTWGSEPRPIQPASGHSDSFGSYNSNSLAPQPTPIKADGVVSKPPVPATDVPMPDSEEIPDLDEGLLNEYLNHSQPVYPILATTKARMQYLLGQCPVSVRNAFSMALLAAVQPSTGDVKLASALLNDWEGSDEPRNQATNIVHAQALLLLIIDADWRASSSLPFLLARAVALANTMKLWRSLSIDAGMESDSEEQLCVRIWWSLVLIDRWYAAGTGKPPQIPDNSVVIPSGLEMTVGETCFHLIRLSKVQSRIAYVISTLPAGATTTEPPMAGILADYIENYREDLPGHIEPSSYPLVHLAYWHCRLLVSHLTPGAAPSEILWPTKELASLLSVNAQMSPLINHFVSLVAMSLGKLYKLEGSREDAGQVIKEILEQPAGLWDSVRDKLAEHMRPASSVEAAASQGLQHLADLATAHEGIAAVGEEMTFGPSLTSGYLDVA